MGYAAKGSAPFTKNWFPSSSYSFVPFTEMGDKASTKLYETNRRHDRRNVNMMGAVPMQPCWLEERIGTTERGPRQEAPREGVLTALVVEALRLLFLGSLTTAGTRPGRRSALDASWGENRQTGIQARGCGSVEISYLGAWCQSGHVKRTATAVVAPVGE